jgi:hypothetical protein
MNALRLECHGARVGRYFLPPFRLHLGEAVCLHVPFLSCSGDEKQLRGVLTEAEPIAGLEQHGPIAWADPVKWERRGFRVLFRDPTVAEWLQQTAGYSPRDALAVVERLGWRTDWRFSALPGTHRALLGLELTYARGCEIILFSTPGLDPAGIRAVHEFVSSRLAGCAAIQISHLDIHQRRWDCLQEDRGTFPAATCLVFEPALGPAAPLTT